MRPILDLVGLIFRGATKIAILLVVTIVILGALCFGLLTAIFMTLNFLLTGRRPTFVTAFHRFRQTAQQYQKGHWSNSSADASRAPSDVVDVESREVRSVLTAPPPTRNTD